MEYVEHVWNDARSRSWPKAAMEADFVEWPNADFDIPYGLRDPAQNIPWKGVQT